MKLNAKVLLVEDNKVNQLVGKSFLARIGCSVNIAEDGKEAMEILEQTQFDIVFMDCQMPVMDGYEATEDIRQKKITSRQGEAIPIIALTADVVGDVRERCMKVGMNDYLSKPFKMNSIQEILEKWLVLPVEI